MAEPQVELPQNPPEAGDAPAARRWPLVATIVLVLLAVALAIVWWQRENLARRVIAGQLEQYHLPATYHLDRVGPLTQVLSEVVVGDSARPDFTATRIEVTITPTFGLPTIGSVRLVQPRLYGSLQGGKLSFGSLDPLLFAPSDRPPGLPDLTVAIDDGRARLDTDAGAVGIKLAGAGNLRDGFSGVLAAVAPQLDKRPCRLSGASAYGKVTTSGGKPSFTGPVRLAEGQCPDLRLRDLAMASEATLAADFASGRGTGKLVGGPLTWAGQQAGGLDGQFDLGWRGSDLTARYRLTANGMSGQLAAQSLKVEGLARSNGGLARLDAEGTITGTGLQPGAALDARLAATERDAAGTLGAPLLEQLRSGLQREGQGSRLEARYSVRHAGALTSVIVPEAELTGTSGQSLLVLSRGAAALGGQGGMRLSGNFRTGGPGLPRLTGTVERRPGGVIEARLALAEYRARDASLALPQLVVIQRTDGAIGFTGQVRVSGALPGGRVDGLALPIRGNWSARRGLAMGRECTPVQFRRLAVANLTLDGRSLTLCPAPGAAILTSDARGTRLAAGAAGLALSGRLGSAPIRLTSGAVGFAVPGRLAARRVDVTLGAADSPNRFLIDQLTAQLGAEISGTFAGTEARLAAVPLDLLSGQGAWRYANEQLMLSQAGFRLEDRQLDDRFRPLISRDATLSLVDGRITAAAALREPASDRLITQVAIAHDLNSGRGHADLAVPGVVFDKNLQPDTLTYLALGVIANARGTVTGNGRIDWNARTVTSTGQFGTEKFDFAAAFGPVEGVSGTVEFTDLLGLVTAPDQRLKIATINPGIEVYNGALSFQLQPDGALAVNGARWPFIDGELTLLPTRMKLGAAEERRFTLKVAGADAAQFIQQLELSNISAHGVFDGELPLIFDENGGRIEGGMLTSRTPGGNLSYIGTLTYKDLGAMANFAFQSLRSLDFKRMEIGLDGQLAGEIVTRVRLDGVSQGVGAKRNFLTRQVASLPIRFNINIRAPFQRMLSSFRSLYDPNFVRDPRELGLVDADGRPVAKPELPQPVPPDIQPSDSRKMP